MANKLELRKQALAQRKALSDIEAAKLSESLLAQLKTLDFSEVKSIHIFLPIVKKQEPNTFLFIEWLTKHHPGVQIIVPKANFENYTMTHHPYLGKADLVDNEYHIPEPQTQEVFKGKIDMVLVPLLAFDLNGYRVGYGKGFYDRFLENIDTQKIGLSFFEPVAQINDVHLDDIRLDKCITPTRIINFGL